MKITSKNLCNTLRKALLDLSSGEKVKVNFSASAYLFYLKLQMEGFFKDLMLVKQSKSLYLARIK